MFCFSGPERNVKNCDFTTAAILSFLAVVLQWVSVWQMGLFVCNLMSNAMLLVFPEKSRGCYKIKKPDRSETIFFFFFLISKPLVFILPLSE